MKKILLILTLFAFLVLPLVGIEARIEPEKTVPELGGEETLKLIKRIVDWVFFFVLLVATVAFILAGLNFITAGGDADKVGKARMWVIYGAVGVLVAFLARGLIALVERMVV